MSERAELGYQFGHLRCQSEMPSSVAGSPASMQGEHEGLEDQDHVGKIGEGSWKFQRGKAVGVW